MKLDRDFIQDLKESRADLFTVPRHSGRTQSIYLYIESGDDGEDYLTGSTFRSISGEYPAWVRERRTFSLPVTDRHPSDVANFIEDYADEIAGCIESDDPHSPRDLLDSIDYECREVMDSETFIDWYNHGDCLGRNAGDYLLDGGTIEGFISELQSQITQFHFSLSEDDVLDAIEWRVENALNSSDVDTVIWALRVDDELDLCLDTEEAIEYLEAAKGQPFETREVL